MRLGVENLHGGREAQQNDRCVENESDVSDIQKIQSGLELMGQTFLVADTRLYTLPCRGRSVGRSVTFLNS